MELVRVPAKDQERVLQVLGIPAIPEREEHERYEPRQAHDANPDAVQVIGPAGLSGQETTDRHHPARLQPRDVADAAAATSANS